MIFIDFGLLPSPYSRISYLLAGIKIRFDNLLVTQCAKIISWIHGKCRQRSYQTFTNVFLNFFPLFTFFNVFLIFFV